MKANTFVKAASLSLSLALLLATTTPMTAAHSWLDCTNMLGSGCAGFPLGYPSRSDVDINTKYTYLVQDRRPDAAVCQPNRQNIPKNNPFPPANVVPGQTLHLTWQPDGHLDDARPSIIEVHWTGVPDTQLQIRSDLTPATLLGVMTFATSGNCDDPREPNTWCHGHITVPQGTRPGTYQMIWWWKYDRNPAGEEYSTCFEIVVAGDTSGMIQTRGIESKPQPEEVTHIQAQTQVNSDIQANTNAFARPDAVAAEKSELTSVEGASLTNVATSDLHQENVQQPLQHNQNAGEVEAVPTALADLAAKADEPLSVIPTMSSNQNGNQELLKGHDYIDDDLGALAGDAINDQEGKDSSPSPLSSPSEVIQAALNGTTVNGTQSNITVLPPPTPPLQNHNSNLIGKDTTYNSANGVSPTSTYFATVISSALAGISLLI
ncbi:hypothetical protein BG004_007014 [Podila humilis]|nr:hypothetical protein BG004_007014 [Podila humilis]